MKDFVIPIHVGMRLKSADDLAVSKLLIIAREASCPPPIIHLCAQSTHLRGVPVSYTQRLPRITPPLAEHSPKETTEIQSGSRDCKSSV